MIRRARWSVILSLWALTAETARAQTGSIVGTIRDSAGGPLATARIYIAALARTAVSRADGGFQLRDIPAGAHDLKVYAIGYQPTAAVVTVRDGEESRVVVQMERIPVRLEAAVVSVSRRTESILDAPASITASPAALVANTLGSPLSLLQRAAGIDVTRVGVTSSFVNGRGFNRVFNSRWLTLEDGRVATFAETGLTIGEHTVIPRIDIAGMEVIAGAGSALYGSNASSGVLSVRTRDPREFPGFTLQVDGGNREFHDVQARYAGAAGRWSYKLAGQAQGASDWADTVFYPAVTAGGAVVGELPPDFRTGVRRAHGSLQYDLGDGSLSLNAGASERDALGQSSQGRYRIDGYRFGTAQVVFRSPRWLAQAYTSASNSGDTYRLKLYSQTRARFPALAADSALAIASFPVDGRIHTAELQYSDMVGGRVRTGVRAIDQAHVTFGAQGRYNHVSSRQKLYSDAVSGRAIGYEQWGFYAQVDAPLGESLRFVAAARHDRHAPFAPRWSPQAGLVYDLAPHQVLRLTAGTGYQSPTILHTDLYGANVAAGLVQIGNRNGFDIRDGSGALVRTIAPIGPETNQTWELGYKGMIGSRLLVDATAYRSRYVDFLAPTAPVSEPRAASPTFAFDHATGQRVEDANGNPLQVLTFINVGEGRFAGFDAALRYALTDRLSIVSTTSLTRLLAVEIGANDPPEAAAFNTSAHRSSLALEVEDARRRFEASVRVRYVQGYDFRSASDWGFIPTQTSLGFSAASGSLPFGTTLVLQADNIAACVGGETTPPASGISGVDRATYAARRTCGVGVRHHEILNMPAVGPLVMIGVRREWR